MGWRLRVLGLAIVASTFSGLTHAQQLAGVHVDADGVLRLQLHDDPTGELNRQRIEQLAATLNPQVAARSTLRKISLTRLEREVGKRLAAGQPLSDEMKCLAGLTRLKYVFYYPDSKDIVIAGPADGWGTDLSGRLVSVSSGRPVLELQDLVVALRAYNAGGESVQTIGCSIDPTPEGLARMQQYLAQFHGSLPDGGGDAVRDGIRTSLGMQKITVYGVSPKTHFANVLVEADYRMKLIGIGLEEPPIRMASYVDKARPGMRNALARWYFVPDYQCVRISTDRLAMELVGDGVKLVGANEMVGADGVRHQSGHTDKASELFVGAFTKKYPQLAEKSPVYAQLRDLIDMAVASAYIRQEGYCAKAEWKLEVFGDETKFPVEIFSAPTQVETAVNALWKGGQLMFPTGGGVTVHAHQALDSGNLLRDDEGRVAQVRQQIKLELADGQWWWD